MFFVGLAVAVALTLFVVWLIRQQLAIKWYEWIIGFLAVASLFATVQHYFSSLEENEPTSAWMGALIFGIIFLILAALDWQLIIRHKKVA
ncbi:hypothetical protein [Dehalococcoides mccartyi]|jgi:hypothetical protein|uniref:Reductive dehalogenase anchoring protein n=2 Tax=Dehalococcoides TaxID=61434 RepID=A0A142VBZ0_9CHLR|nr:hypothetical protein [Dehalococcoides mccartyi]AGG08552.1 putative reductive dehalogenase anchoring protein [Dehalococcoides mccartyi BTF08]AII61535.1 dehalogenase [Dehalococcoides mccartyi CG5]AMU87328.1 reductive dehalogenase anchoring protein [Dehalococcoides mccartyi]AOV99975.1 reductive dehalogenase membrane anchor [Dehalococcoides mccartyi]AQX73848.1 reductive dehalogenase membrane anchor [Dehalococcoides mccartyi]